MADVGGLEVQVFRANSSIPLSGARVTVTPTTQEALNEELNREVILLNTNEVGKTETIQLETPPLERSLNVENNLIPYGLCNVTVDVPGYDQLIVRGCQIFPGITALQECNLFPLGTARKRHEGNRESNVTDIQIIDIPKNTLFGIFPPKIPEDEIKPLPPPTGGVVLPQVVVPEFITVHDGVPTNASAPNYRVPYNDYIKNVASSEIYATWNESAIRANLLCIISFTLNRVFTEWYRGKGYNFDITSSTAYDQKFSYGRNIYDNISTLVDELFSTYIRRPSQKQPLFAQYCDGNRVQCPGWLSQWGSQSLGTQGYVPFEILTNYYGSNLELSRAERVSGSPQSYPGYTLDIGSSGEPVRVVQTFLNRISQNYPLIPKVAVDGRYGPATAEQVRVFQGVFGLPVTGKVDYATWYKISNIYVGVTKIAELRRTIPKQEYGYFTPPVAYEEAVDVPKIRYPKD